MTKSECLFLHFLIIDSKATGTSFPVHFSIWADISSYSVTWHERQLSFKDGMRRREMQHKALMGTAGEANMRKPGVRAHAPLCGPPRVRGMRGMATSSPQMPSPLRPELGRSKTFPCCWKYTVYLLQCISNNNSSTAPQEFLVQADTRRRRVSFAPNTERRGDPEVKLLPFVQPFICQITRAKHQWCKGKKIRRVFTFMSYICLCHWGYVLQLYIKTNGLICMNI